MNYNYKQTLLSLTIGGIGGAIIGIFFYPVPLDIAVSSTIGAIGFNVLSETIKSLYISKQVIQEGPPLTISVKKIARPKANEPD